MMNQSKNNPDSEKFIMYFYNDCADTLFKPLEDIPEFKAHSRKHRSCLQLEAVDPAPSRLDFATFARKDELVLVSL
jgi:hypothetical protein